MLLFSPGHNVPICNILSNYLAPGGACEILRWPCLSVCVCVYVCVRVRACVCTSRGVKCVSMLKHSDIYDIWEPIIIVIFNESVHTFLYILPVGPCTPDTNVTCHTSSVDIEPNNAMAYISKTGPTISFKYVSWEPRG